MTTNELDFIVPVYVSITVEQTDFFYAAQSTGNDAIDRSVVQIHGLSQGNWARFSRALFAICESTLVVEPTWFTYANRARLCKLYLFRFKRADDNVIGKRITDAYNEFTKLAL